MASNYDIDEATIVKRLTFDRVVQLTNDAGGDTIDEDNLDEAILSAEEEFELYAARFFAVPVRSAGVVPAGVRRKLIDLACWFLMLRRSELLKNSDDEGAFWKDRREELLDWMQNLSPASIAGADLATPTGVTKLGTAKVVSDRPLFTRSRMRGFF